MEFDPTGKPTPGYFNLWRGFAVEPKEGDCSLLLDHVRKNICRGDAKLFEWVMGFLAQIIQQPATKTGTALVLRGKQGVGKTILGKAIGSLLGPYHISAAHRRHIIGNFNAHLKAYLLLQCEEAFFAGDHEAEGVIKDLISNDTQMLEFKGKDVVRIKNYARLIVTSNHDWVVSAGLDERRTAVLDVGEENMQDHPYFAAIENQLDNGGREALLYYLLNFDLTTVDLHTIPKTEALLEQKFASLDPKKKWLLDLLMNGRLPWGADRMRHGPNSCPSRKLLERYIAHAGRSGARHKSNATEFGIFLRKFVPGIKKVDHGTCLRPKGGSLEGGEDPFDRYDETVYELPPLAECRAAFAKELRQEVNWGIDDPWKPENMPVDDPDGESPF